MGYKIGKKLCFFARAFTENGLNFSIRSQKEQSTLLTDLVCSVRFTEYMLV